MNTTPRYDAVRERLDKITTWLLFGTLTFLSPVDEPTRIELFYQTIRQLERRLKLFRGELRWVLAQEGDHTLKLYHFHFLLDGSNLQNRDPKKLAENFEKIWEKVGGGNPDVEVHALERADDGFQKSVNYVCQVDSDIIPFSAYFNAGEHVQLKFSASLDKHLATVCAVNEDKQPKE